ncbi:MAG: peptidyl-tRNA hydrolase, family [Patescibacteria group bacterium]|jgi:PTH1 family peptidyl-tRNA hydrolase|nr:peptidyl-tRNA hydrolase, family [Patescibacteria group bacterium]
MYLIVGLGNPGEKYSKTRHNVGFILLDFFVNGWQKDKYAEALVSKDFINGSDVIYVKPETFMNDSGRSVSYLKEKFEIPNENIFVVYDDIDLPFGEIRISHDRGDGGHNGIKSIVSCLESRDFTRLRFGIAPSSEDGRAIKPKGGFFTPASKAVSNFVLKDFSASDLEKIKNLSAKVEEIIKTFVKEGRGVVMNKFN